MEIKPIESLLPLHIELLVMNTESDEQKIGDLIASGAREVDGGVNIDKYSTESALHVS